jgi:chromate transporter
MTKDRFYQGLALAQSLPGPLFNFAAFLGGVYKGVPGAFLGKKAFFHLRNQHLSYLKPPFVIDSEGAIGIFGPGVLLIFAAMPFWAKLRSTQWFVVVVQGLNSTAMGLIGAACVILFTNAISTTADAIVFYVALTLSGTYGWGAPWVVLSGGILGGILSKQAASLGQVNYCSK